jgi:ComF family protein
VCEDCLSQIRPIAGGVCSVCGDQLLTAYAFSGQNAEPLCGLCRRIEPPFAQAAAYGSYDGGLRELIHLLKYERVRPAANVLGRMLSEVITNLKPRFGGSPLVVVPVPLHARKLRQRGFNQAELILRAAMKFNPAPGQLIVNGGILERRRETQSQIGLTRHQRRENLRGAFAVAKPGEIQDREILLVDDVFTTGTTVSECARVLRRAGATRVWVATVARTLKTNAATALLATEQAQELAAAAHGSS